ncbi:hypothetical protein AVEN_234267-1 [Araneus ventricosus]|uniref:Mariner Mos1 transposase n=1 Tax=Araneus ventricosus TaxID=182803 RepID=A0A4Y2A9L3_ARAVE|nr:hypothetical protein AVEN_234267-1 [Araneus ventricosus]
MLAEDRRLSFRMIAEELKISLDSVSDIIHEHLQKRKICARFVPHKLSDEQKQHKMETSGDFIDACDRNPQFLETIVTGDESSSTIRKPSGSGAHRCRPPKICRLTTYRIKTLLITFSDNKGLIHHEFVPAGTTVNAESYEGVLKRLLQRIRQVWTQLYQSG